MNSDPAAISFLEVQGIFIFSLQLNLSVIGHADAHQYSEAGSFNKYKHVLTAFYFFL